MSVNISVVIPCFNASAYIAQTISSVFSQDRDDVEVIVIDDKSTDDTRGIVEQLAREYPGPVRVVCGAGKGPAAARNVGISEAGGAYVAFLDADDLWLPHKLEKQFRRLEEAGEEGLVYTDRSWVDGNGEMLSESPLQETFPEGYVFTDMIAGNYLVTSSVLVPKEALVRVGGFSEAKEFTNCQDYHLWLRLAEIIPFYAVKEPLIKYRVHDNNRHKNVRPRYVGLVACLEYAKGSSFWKTHSRKPFEALLKQRLGAFHGSYARTFFRQGDFRWAWHAALSGLRCGMLDWRLLIIAGVGWLPENILRRLAALK
ncbi:glycosyltransferase family 2 protein [Marinobacter halotolerans]|uniref:glycosyltransferase family 2 protein n=1 Tax=Marinobacter halotolerans TaxID=1569211 RepID=UPI0012467572|nr:glycosyltransferase [Marinobacter halotolerans]